MPPSPVVKQLVGVEAERARVAEAATAPTLVRGAVGLGGVLDDRQTVPLRQVEQGIHIHRVPIDVYGHDGPRALGDAAFDLSTSIAHVRGLLSTSTGTASA